MRKSATLAWGLVLVAVDIRFGTVDVVPDPIGWLMARTSRHDDEAAVGP